MKKKIFPCTKCGCCCKRMDKLKEYTGDNFSTLFPYGFDSTGRCDKLTEGNTCSIYETRPLICSIDEMMPFFKMKKKEYYKLNIKACNEMMDYDNVSKELRIK